MQQRAQTSTSNRELEIWTRDDAEIWKEAELGTGAEVWMEEDYLLDNDLWMDNDELSTMSLRRLGIRVS